jgi:hypothetical protein
MRGFKQNLVNYGDKKFNVKVELGDDDTYAIKGVGSASFQLQSSNVFHVEEIIYVPGLKKNIISVAVLESKGYTIAFSKGKALMWHSNESMSSTMIIGVQEDGLYKVAGQVIQALAHEMINPCELWHIKFGHLNYDALPGLQKMVIGMPVFLIVFVEVVLLVKIQRKLTLAVIEKLMVFYILFILISMDL